MNESENISFTISLDVMGSMLEELDISAILETDPTSYQKPYTWKRKPDSDIGCWSYCVVGAWGEEIDDLIRRFCAPLAKHATKAKQLSEKYDVTLIIEVYWKWNNIGQYSFEISTQNVSSLSRFGIPLKIWTIPVSDN